MWAIFTQRCLELAFSTIPAARPGLFAPSAKKRPHGAGDGRPSAESAASSDNDDLETVASYEMVGLASDRGREAGSAAGCQDSQAVTHLPSDSNKELVPSEAFCVTDVWCWYADFAKGVKGFCTGLKS